MTETFYKHTPVLLNESIQHLITSTDGIYVDATFGRGSHSQFILHHLSPQGRLFAFDKDLEAVQYAQIQMKQDSRFTIFHHAFSQMQPLLTTAGVVGQVNGVLLDLGVSSPQLDNPERGFSFSRAGKLDMRMDTTRGVAAMEWLARVREKELADILWQFGEERCSRKIARTIVAAREKKPITTTIELADVISSVMPKNSQEKHVATRSFQAIRIFINQELTELQQALTQALEILAVGGRLLVISFHSLEDRIVKQFIKTHSERKPELRGLPIKYSANEPQRLKALGKPIKPSLQEMKDNPRSRSAILRIAEKIS